MPRSRNLALTGGVASLAAVVATIATAPQLRAGLADAYSYPNAQGIELEEAASMTLTYLFAIAIAGLLTALVYAFIHRLADSPTGWWVGLVLTVAALALATYNAAQVLPLAVKIAFFLPALAGAIWLTRARTDLPDSATA